MSDRTHVEARFLAKVVRLPNGCWQWTGARRGKYGGFTVAGASVAAHRWAFERWIGAIPSGKDMDHYRYPQDGCIGPICTNPEHVRPTSTRENVLRSNCVSALAAAKTHCPRGHPYTGENLYVQPSTGGRRCRACKRSERERSSPPSTRRDDPP